MRSLPYDPAIEKVERLAEIWTLNHIIADTLVGAAYKANSKQLTRICEVLDSMYPLSPQNPFWVRNELPERCDVLHLKIAGNLKLIKSQLSDQQVADARRIFITGNSNDREKKGDTIDQVTKRAFGFVLPHDWTGNVYVQGDTVAFMNSGKNNVPEIGKEPDWFGVYGQRADGSHKVLVYFLKKADAVEVCRRLTYVASLCEATEPVAKQSTRHIDEHAMHGEQAVSNNSATHRKRSTACQAELSAVQNQKVRDISEEYAKDGPAPTAPLCSALPRVGGLPRIADDSPKCLWPQEIPTTKNNTLLRGRPAR
jgi:hypothetical protein